MLFFIVLISPSQIVAYRGGSATFLCTRSTGIIRGIQWFINYTQIENLQYRTEEEFFPDNGNLGQLHFTNITLDLDMSRITCAVEFESGSIESSSTQSVLRVQGKAYRYMHLRCFSGPYSLCQNKVRASCLLSDFFLYFCSALCVYTSKNR